MPSVSLGRMLVYVFAALCLLALGSAETKTYHFIHIGEDELIHQDITHDDEANTVIVVVGDVSMYPGRISTMSFHDFDTKYTVVKDIRRGLCLLTLTPVPAATPELYSMGATNLTSLFDGEVIWNALTTSEVEAIASRRLASFCTDYETHYMILTPKSKISKRPADHAHTPSHAHCGGCHFVLQNYYDQNILG